MLVNPYTKIRGERETHIIHIRHIPDNLYCELWALRYYLKASSWVQVLEWAVEKYHEELGG